MTMTTEEVARYLGVTNPKTVKNWLEGGEFPMSYLTMNDGWRFDVRGVEEVKARLDDLRDRNARGDTSLPDGDDDDSHVPLL